MWTHPTEKKICHAVLNLQTLEETNADDVEEENSNKPLTNKDIVEAFSVLREAVQHCAYKKDFEYERIVIKLLDAQTQNR